MIEFQQRTLIHAPIQRCFDLARSVNVQPITRHAKHFGIWQNLTSEMTAVRPPAYFQQTMRAGVLREMQADHYFRAMPSGATEMLDRVRIPTPFRLLGRLAEFLFLRRYFTSINQNRCQTIKQIAESSDWSRYLPGK